MSESTASVRHEPLPLGVGPGMSAFARALRTGAGDALRFLAAPPRDDEGWVHYLDSAAAAAPEMPDDLVERLAQRQEAIGAGAQAIANARSLGTGALAVVTGQQPGLLGGPLLTFHKAAGAIALAHRLDGVGGKRVVPVFWLASEDHDLDEANRAVLIDRQGQARRLRVPLEPDGRSLMDIELESEEALALAAEVRALLPETERGVAAASMAADGRSGRFDQACLRALLEVFGDSGLIVVEPPVLAPQVGVTYAWLLDHAATIQTAIATCGRELESAGLPAPLAPREGATALFFRERPGGPRLRVGLQRDGTLTLRDQPVDRSVGALKQLLLDEPMRGSGNVAGRVFVQNRHLPVVAYIAGPTEIAYQAQLRAAHETLGAFFPLALPRPEATWIDAKSASALGSFGRTPADVLAGDLEVPGGTDSALDEALERIRARLAALDDEAAALLERGGRGADALRRAFERTTAAWAKAEKAVQAGFEADAGVGRARWERMLGMLRPLGKPQERQLSPWSLVARHGLDAVRRGLEHLDPLAPVHHILHLEG